MLAYWKRTNCESYYMRALQHIYLSFKTVGTATANQQYNNQILSPRYPSSRPKLLFPMTTFLKVLPCPILPIRPGRHGLNKKTDIIGNHVCVCACVPPIQRLHGTRRGQRAAESSPYNCCRPPVFCAKNFSTGRSVRILIKTGIFLEPASSGGLEKNVRLALKYACFKTSLT